MVPRLTTITLGAALTLAATALGGSDATRQTASYELNETRPSQATAERFVFDYVNPDDPAAKPPAVQKVTTILPRGARYDPTVPESCTASDAELIAAGGAACPPGSAIGGGVITVDTGFPDPGRIVTADTEFFNNATDPAGEFIYLNTVRGSDARTVIRADVTRRTTVTVAGMLPGTPPDGGAIDTVDVTVDELGSDSGGYITTPKRCRGRRNDPHWTTRVEFSYGDGVTETVPTRTPCVKEAQG